MTVIHMKGPFRFTGDDASIDDIPAGINGIYLWCVRAPEGFWRVHYVGEAVNVQGRLQQHRKHLLSGNYTGYCPKGLRQNIKILMHRAREGMIGKYAHIDRNEFNLNLLGHISIFYADLGPEADKDTRCRYEYALYTAVEEHGQNILDVSYLRRPGGDRFEASVDCGDSRIEGLDGAVLRV